MSTCGQNLSLGITYFICIAICTTHDMYDINAFMGKYYTMECGVKGAIKYFTLHIVQCDHAIGMADGEMLTYDIVLWG